MAANTIKLPLAKGVIQGIHIVIPECPLCGMKHLHGSVEPGYYQIGDITTRAPHCYNRHGNGWEYNNIAIKIIDDVGPNGKVKGMSRRRKPRRMPAPPMIELTLEEVGK